jgi:Lon protease-like protein
MGCAGLITHAEPVGDGRSNIVLQGLEKFRILDEQPGGSYRRGIIEPLLEPTETADRALRQARHKLEALVAPVIERAGADLHIPASIPDHELINALAQYLPLEPVEKQALLERDGTLSRCMSLIELLEMKVILQRACTTRTFAH